MIIQYKTKGIVPLLYPESVIVYFLSDEAATYWSPWTVQTSLQNMFEISDYDSMKYHCREVSGIRV